MKFYIKYIRFFVGIFLLFLIGCPSMANVNSYGAGSVQKEIEKSIIDEHIEKEVTEREITPKAKKVQPKPEDLKTNQEQESIENYRIMINKVKFEGNSVYSEVDLAPYTEMIEGKSILLNDLIEFTLLITRKYHYDGYLTSYAYLPEQEIKNGEIVIKIHESKINEIAIKGNKWVKDRFYRQYLMYPAKIRQGRIFNVNELDVAMKRFDQEPYTKEVIRVAETNEGETEINVNVKEHIPFVINATYDDGGRDVIGLQRARLVMGVDNLTGWGDKVYGGTVLADGTTGVLAGYSIPIWKYGTRLHFDYGYTHVKLGEEYKDYDLTGKSENFSLRLVHPIIQTTATEVNASLGIDFTNTKSHFGIYNKDTGSYSLRVIRSAVYGIHDDRYGRTFLSLNGDFGIRGLGATGVDDAKAKPNFSKVYMSAIRMQRIPVKDSYLVFRLDGQYAPDPLYPAEQFQLGGFNSVRGYEPGSMIGDYGVSGSAEYRTAVPFLKKILPEKYKSVSDRVKLVLFYDFGFIKVHRDLYSYKKNFIHSVGAGLNFNLPFGITLNTAVGIPICDDDYKRGSVRFHFTLSTAIDKILFYKFQKEEL